MTPLEVLWGIIAGGGREALRRTLEHRLKYTNWRTWCLANWDMVKKYRHYSELPMKDRVPDLDRVDAEFLYFILKAKPEPPQPPKPLIEGPVAEWVDEVVQMRYELCLFPTLALTETEFNKKFDRACDLLEKIMEEPLGARAARKAYSERLERFRDFSSISDAQVEAYRKEMEALKRRLLEEEAAKKKSASANSVSVDLETIAKLQEELGQGGVVMRATGSSIYKCITGGIVIVK